MRPRHRWKNLVKKCAVCRMSIDERGMYLPLLEDKTRQQWCCEGCIVKATSPFIIQHIFEGTLPVRKAERSAAVQAATLRHEMAPDSVTAVGLLGRPSVQARPKRKTVPTTR